MKCADIRQAFLDYFARQHHEVVASSSLVPDNDPTLLFTNAGMVQFKDVFLGLDKRDYNRATSSQRCVRAGGKHNDLENVGYTARHHTFFEMLGNFSFGDYFKREAIRFAWEFLTDVLKLPPEKLWITVHISDDEAADIWLKEVGVPASRFSRLDEDNFWQMGDTGPCGPCSEIFYDHGEDVPGGPPGSENDDLDRYIEIWNLVFMQYERQADGELVPLPKPSVDTGMGLERIAAVLQGVHSNYDIDLFQALIASAMEATNTQNRDHKSLRVIADHIRSCSFLISDGVLPSNDGRGYVLRRIIRRAVRHGHKLGQRKPFFHQLVSALVAQMGGAYPELVERRDLIEKALLKEEQQFAKTLDKGLRLLEDAVATSGNAAIPGEIIFKLHDTYGFPVDLTNDIAREKNLTLDLEEYERLMEGQRQRAREAGAFKVDYTESIKLAGETIFSGYEHVSQSAKIIAIVVDGEQRDQLESGQDAAIVLESTPFYGESGGQVGDSGRLCAPGAQFDVTDCQKNGGHHLHIGTLVSGSLSVGVTVKAEVNEAIRSATAANHSATHLLHAALRKILGEHVTQKGSLVDSEKLRFDFSHPEPVSSEQLWEITRLVNAQIRGNSEVQTESCDMETAKSRGAMMLFGEKYGDEVRVLSMGEGFSTELCGGTHVSRTGDIGLFRVVAESGIAAGVRRIEAVTGELALSLVHQVDQYMIKVAAQLKTQPNQVPERLEQLTGQLKAQEKQLQQLHAKLASASIDDWLSEAEEVGRDKLLIKQVAGMDAKTLPDVVDRLKNKLRSGAVVLATVDGSGKVALIAGVTKALSTKLKAGDLVSTLAKGIGGKGGGRPDMARGGGSDAEKLPAALDATRKYAKSVLTTSD